MREQLLVEDRGALRLIIMSRPAKRNALNTERTRARPNALEGADDGEAIGAAVLSGTERMRAFTPIKGPA